MVCRGIQRGFVIQMAIVKQIETFLKRFGSIRPTSGGKLVQHVYIHPI